MMSSLRMTDIKKILEDNSIDGEFKGILLKKDDKNNIMRATIIVTDSTYWNPIRDAVYMVTPEGEGYRIEKDKEYTKEQAVACFDNNCTEFNMYDIFRKFLTDDFYRNFYSRPYKKGP